MWTIGHSTRPLEELVDLLRAHGIDTVVDVRTVPRSRRHPHFTKDALALSLPQAAIAYVHLPGLGGQQVEVAVIAGYALRLLQRGGITQRLRLPGACIRAEDIRHELVVQRHQSAHPERHCYWRPDFLVTRTVARLEDSRAIMRRQPAAIDATLIFVQHVRLVTLEHDVHQWRAGGRDGLRVALLSIRGPCLICCIKIEQQLRFDARNALQRIE